MLGLINRALQCFLRDTYGSETWARIARRAEVGAEGFEPLLIYDDAWIETVLQAATEVLARPRDTVLEDMGTYLVSHRNLESVRRLLRFGGVGFVDFLQRMEDLPEHARLGLPDLELPQFDLKDLGDGEFLLNVSQLVPGVGHLIVGLLRAMADDYGALVLLEHRGVADGGEQVAVTLLDQSYAAGRRFDLIMAGEP